ncbi:MAG: transfer protein [Bacteroidota bacterium]|nr:transfer protein [Bacteroidota bacterium]
MDNLQKTAIIAFFSAEGYFRLHSETSKTKKIEALKEQFEIEFQTELNQEILDILELYRDEQRAVKHAREKARIEKLKNLPLSAGCNKSNEHIQYLPHGKYVLTSAQNNTDIDNGMLESLQTFCKENGARLLIGRLTYNKNGFAQPDINNNDGGLWYAPEIKPYLVSGHLCLGSKHHFIADANIMPTAKNPLIGFAGIVPAGENAYLPATKISLKVEAALKNAKVKLLASTGTVTKRNYILRKVGATAAIEHSIGALYINTETDEIRHLEQMEGFTGFYDLTDLYLPDGKFTLENHISALQLGDIHAEKVEDKNLHNAIDLIQDLQPKSIIIHDLQDFSSRNHHNIKDPAFLHVQHVNNNTVQGDLKLVAKILDKLISCLPDSSDIHVIESNHDLAINTWLKNSDFKVDPVNAVTYLTCMLALYKHQEKTGNSQFNMLKYAYKQIGRGKYADKIQFHETDESVMISGVEMGNHGHNGVNGSRGSPMQFRTLGVAMNTGHTHTPGITGKVYTAGVTASLEMGYNLGASSWAIAHIVTYENGQRQIIFA